MASHEGISPTPASQHQHPSISASQAPDTAARGCVQRLCGQFNSTFTLAFSPPKLTQGRVVGLVRVSPWPSCIFFPVLRVYMLAEVKCKVGTLRIGSVIVQSLRLTAARDTAYFTFKGGRGFFAIMPVAYQKRHFVAHPINRLVTLTMLLRSMFHAYLIQ